MEDGAAESLHRARRDAAPDEPTDRLAGCAPGNTNTTYTAGAIGVAAEVRYGTIVGMRPVASDEDDEVGEVLVYEIART